MARSIFSCRGVCNVAADRIRRGGPFLSFLLFLGLDYIVYTYITTLYPPT